MYANPGDRDPTVCEGEEKYVSPRHRGHNAVVRSLDMQSNNQRMGGFDGRRRESEHWTEQSQMSHEPEHSHERIEPHVHLSLSLSLSLRISSGVGVKLVPRSLLYYV